MSWRILQISKPCKLYVKNKQLIYEPKGENELTLPLEDISVIILDNHQIMISNYLFSELAEYGIVLFTVDGSHIPSGVMFPFHNHSRYSEIAWQQVNISEPLKKRLWQHIVKAKINNQAECLRRLDKDNTKKLREIAKQVQSGDCKNAEAFAANIYWKSLFDDFNRRDDSDIRNSALNYGYAVIRGCVARAVVGAGLVPCFGLHHANKLNQFNLVDDIMEPFRPFVDYKVIQLDLSTITELTPLIKNKILSVLTENCGMQDESINILKSSELAALSVVKAIKNESTSLLVFPKFI